MICKNCNREIPEDANFCLYCGRSKSSMRPWQWALIAVCALVVLAALVYGILTLAGLLDGSGNGEPALNTEQNAQQENQPADDGSEDGASLDELLAENSRNVVASMGGKTLTVGELQMHYQTVFYDFYSQNYYYLSYLGLDPEQPLDEQYVPTDEGEEPMTWQDYFIEAALDNWHSYVQLELAAEDAGFEMEPELQAAMDDMQTNVQQMATAYGYDSVEAWLLSEIGTGVTVEDYTRYNQAYYMGSSYLKHFYEVNTPALEEIEAYYTENEEVFLQNNVTKDLGLNAAVRHILIQPTDTAKEEDWASAKAEAERIWQEWKDGDATEESFAELANTYSTDGGSNTTGGLYEDVNVDANYVANFENWAIDDARIPGDTDIVETEFGYHIMYFVEGEPYWTVIVGEQLIADMVKEMLRQNMERYPLEVYRENILVGELKL